MFSTEKEARIFEREIDRQVEVNSIGIGEQHANTKVDEEARRAIEE